MTISSRDYVPFDERYISYRTNKDTIPLCKEWEYLSSKKMDSLEARNSVLLVLFDLLKKPKAVHDDSISSSEANSAKEINVCLMLEYYIANQINLFFKDNSNHKHAIYDEMVFLLGAAENKREFDLYFNKFYFVLMREYNVAVSLEDEEQLKKVIKELADLKNQDMKLETQFSQLTAIVERICGQNNEAFKLMCAICLYGITRSNIKDLNAYYNQHVADVVLVGVQAIAAPAAGFVSHAALEAARALNVGSKMKNLAAVATQGNKNQSKQNRFVTNFKIGLTWIEQRPEKISNWMRHNPGKAVAAIFLGIPSIALLPLAILFFPLTITLIGALVGTKKLIEKSIIVNQATNRGVDRINRFSELIENLRKKSTYRPLIKKELSSSTTMVLEMGGNYDVLTKQLAAQRDAQLVEQKQHEEGTKSADRPSPHPSAASEQPVAEAQQPVVDPQSPRLKPGSGG